MKKKWIATLAAAAIGGIFAAAMALQAQDQPQEKPPGACAACRTTFQACRDKARADYPGRANMTQRRAAIEACRTARTECITPCRECKTMCQANKQEGVNQCKIDFNPGDCNTGDQVCIDAITAEQNACIAAVRQTNCNTQCTVQ